MTADVEVVTRVEMAFGANLAADPGTWTWTDITRRTTAGSRTTVHDQTFTLDRGRADESSQVRPAEISFTVDNPDGALTPRNPRSPWWPDVVRGTPCRVSIVSPDMHLDLPGSPGANATTPDHSTLDITGDIDIRVVAAHRTWRSPRTIASKWATSGNQRSWLLDVSADGRLGFHWSPDGTAAAARTARSSVPVPAAPKQKAVRVTVDVDNGAGGVTVTFQTSDSLAGTWDTLGDPVVAAGTTSIHSGTAAVEIGTGAGAGGIASNLAFAGRVAAAEIRSGIGGSAVASPNFAGQPSGTTGFNDAQGRSWTVNPPAEISGRHVRFVGHVAELRPSRPRGNIGVSVVEVVASGMLRRLSQGQKPLDSSLRRRIMAWFNVPALLAYWPGEDDGGVRVASPLPDVRPLWTSGYDLGADDVMASSLPLPRVSNGPCGWTGPVPAPATTLTDWALDMFVSMPTAPAATFLIAAVSATGTVRQWRLLVNSTQLSLVAVDLNGSTLVNSSMPITNGRFTAQPVLLRLDIAQSGGNIAWALSWVPMDQSNIAFGTSGTVAGTIGRPTASQQLNSASPADGFTWGHIVLSTGLGLGWLAGAEVAFNGETAGDRFVRLCSEENVAGEMIGDPADTEKMGPQRPETLIRLLEECAAADLGILGEARDRPALSFRAGATMHNQAPAVVLDHSAGHVVPPFDPIDDDQALRNDVTATRTAGSSARVTDDVSVALNGSYTASVTLNVETDEQLDHHASWRVTQGTWPEMRYPDITPDLEFHSALASEWLDVDEGDLAKIVGLPGDWPPGDVLLTVEGSADSWDQRSWRPKVNMSPGGPWQVGVLDTDGTPDVTMRPLDTDGSAVDTAVDTDDTSLVVDVTSGPLWTTAASAVPFDIMVDGERMTVTAVTGATSPQTMTVTRAVNGIARSHAVGVPVAVADPLRLTL